MITLSPTTRSESLRLAGLVGVPLLCLIWAFWTTLLDIAHSWASNPQYSHGYLVPVFALFLLWLRRDRLDKEALRPTWWGLPILMLGLALRLGGAYYHYVWFDAIALLPCLIGLCLLMGGWAAWRWAWPAIFFLFFMIPLPYRVATSLAGPLQKLATVTSTYALQTLGLPALAEGNVILLNDAQIGIVEACSGLRMLVVFFALATGMILVIHRPWADKVVLVVSAIPIALAANILRITITGLLHETTDSEVAEVFFHDVAGWLMMPLALGMLWLELKILSRLFIDAPEGGRGSSRRQRSTPVVGTSRRSRVRAETNRTENTVSRESRPRRPGNGPSTSEPKNVPEPGKQVIQPVLEG